MKKYVVITSALAFALTAACSSEGGKTAPAPSPSPQAETTPEPSVIPASSATPVPSGTPAPSASPAPQSKPGEKFDFRGTRWGMSKAQVKAAEPRQPNYETDDSLTFTGNYHGKMTYITYQFRDDKLYRTGTMNVEKQENAKYLENYENVKQEVIKAYGAPVIDGEKQLNPAAVIDPDKKADAVCKGDLMYGAQWNIPGSVVFLSFRGDGEKCLVTLIYSSEDAIKSLSEQDGPNSLGITK